MGILIGTPRSATIVTGREWMLRKHKWHEVEPGWWSRDGGDPVPTSKALAIEDHEAEGRAAVKRGDRLLAERLAKAAELDALADKMDAAGLTGTVRLDCPKCCRGQACETHQKPGW